MKDDEIKAFEKYLIEYTNRYLKYQESLRIYLIENIYGMETE